MPHPHRLHRRAPGEHAPVVCPPTLVHADDAAATGVHTRALLGVVCVATALLLLNISAPNVELPAIGGSLHASFGDLQWVISGYSLALAALMLTAGSLADRIGRKRVFVAGLAGFAATSLLCAVAPSVIVLVAARALQGVAAAAIYTTSLALLAQGFQGVARARAIAIWGATVAAAFGAGPVVGGLLTDAWNWRAIFFVNLALTLAAIPLAVAHLSESADEAAPHADRPGFGLLTTGLFLGVFALIRGDALGWTSPMLLGIAGGAVALLAAFVAVERIERWPMLDMHLFRNHTFVGASAIGLLQPAAAFAMFFFVTLFLLNVRGDSPPVAGLEVLPYAVVSLAVSIGAGRASSRLPTRIVLVVGLLLCGAGLLLFHGLDATGSWTQLVPGLVVLGAGTGLVNPALTFAALGVVPRARSGMASGVNNTFRQLGVAAGVAAFGAVLETRVRAHVDGALAGTRGVGTQVNEVARLLAGHREDAALRLVPPGARHAVSTAYGAAFAASVGDIALVAAVLTFAAAVLAAVLVRKQDFAVEPQPAPVAAPAATPAQ